MHTRAGIYLTPTYQPQAAEYVSQGEVYLSNPDRNLHF
jgi:hypothetical protein